MAVVVFPFTFPPASFDSSPIGTAAPGVSVAVRCPSAGGLRGVSSPGGTA